MANKQTIDTLQAKFRKLLMGTIIAYLISLFIFSSLQGFDRLLVNPDSYYYSLCGILISYGIIIAIFIKETILGKIAYALFGVVILLGLLHYTRAF